MPQVRCVDIRKLDTKDITYFENSGGTNQSESIGYRGGEKRCKVRYKRIT